MAAATSHEVESSVIAVQLTRQRPVAETTVAILGAIDTVFACSNICEVS
jgi:hypothetical protein